MDALLKLMREDASLSPAELARRLGRSEEEVAGAIKDYEEKHVILGYRTLIDEGILGEDRVRAVIEVKITPERQGGFKRLAARIARFHEVRSCCLMSGGYDLMVVVEGGSLTEVAGFVAKRLATLERVISTSTHFMLESYKEHGVLMFREEETERLMVSP